MACLLVLAVTVVIPLTQGNVDSKPFLRPQFREILEAGNSLRSSRFRPRNRRKVGWDKPCSSVRFS